MVGPALRALLHLARVAGITAGQQLWLINKKPRGAAQPASSCSNAVLHSPCQLASASQRGPTTSIAMAHRLSIADWLCGGAPRFPCFGVVIAAFASCFVILLACFAMLLACVVLLLPLSPWALHVWLFWCRVCLAVASLVSVLLASDLYRCLRCVLHVLFFC